MALTLSTLRKPLNRQVVDPSTGVMREEWELYFSQLTAHINSAVGELGGDKAPADAEYIVGGPNGTLTAERVATNSASNTWNLSTPGQAAVERAALTGDVTASANSNATTIANDAVTYAKMQNVSATSRILGRKTSGAGDTEECTLSEVLDFIGSAAQGDILYRGASAWERLAAGSAPQILKTGGPNPSWDSPFNVLGIRWALIDQTTNNNLSGTYVRSGTTVTVTMTSHGLQVGHVVYLDFTSGAATDGLFVVATVPDANTFTVTHGASGATSGNVTWVRHTIVGSSGVASVTDRVGSDGRSVVNFSVAASSANYGWFGTARDGDDGGDYVASPPTGTGLANTTMAAFMNVQDSGPANANSVRLSVMTVGA